MNMQSVNLYLPELREKKEWLTANTTALCTLGFSVLMIMAMFLIENGLVDYEEKVELVESQKIAAEKRIVRIKNMPRANTIQFDRKLLRLTRKVRARERIGQIILGQNLGNEAGFSAALNDLAYHAISSISLQQIRISRGGKFVEMRGITKTVEDVPIYLQRLRGEKSFSDSRFGLMSVAKSANSFARHKFALGFESIYQLALEKGVN